MRRLFRFLVWMALLAALVVGVARLFFLRWWRVPENDAWLEASVAPTLRSGDLVLLWRFTPPTFGDLAYCPEPNAPGRVVLGRIAAEAGDRIEVSPRAVKLNGKAITNERTCGEFEVTHPEKGEPVELRCVEEVLAGVMHRKAMEQPELGQASSKEVEVPEGQVFLLSDNRVFPYDSRDFGLVERQSCKEFVFFRLVSRRGYGDVESRFSFIR